MKAVAKITVADADPGRPEPAITSVQCRIHTWLENVHGRGRTPYVKAFLVERGGLYFVEFTRPARGGVHLLVAGELSAWPS